MLRIKLIIMLILSMIIMISISGSNQPVVAQAPSNLSSNTTRIMENTSGMIDDAFDALKDSFGSFFGGN